MEAVSEDKDDIAVLDVFVEELVSFPWIVSFCTALEGEVVGVLLRWRSEIHLKSVVREYMEQCIAGVT